jgi:ribosome-associated protein
VSAADIATQWARTAAAAAADKKAEDIVAFDVSGVLVITDAFLVCTAGNPRQVAAVVDEVERRLKAAGAQSVRREGQREGGWVLLDFIDLVVHVQSPEARTMYDLERLWRDQPQIDLSDLPTGT